MLKCNSRRVVLNSPLDSRAAILAGPRNHGHGAILEQAGAGRGVLRRFIVRKNLAPVEDYRHSLADHLYLHADFDNVYRQSSAERDDLDRL